MASTFFGLNIATSGIFAAQAGLQVTGHNISNENTKGYSRQVANQSAANAIRAYASYGMIGAGVNVTGIERIRDEYYDVKYRNNASKLSEFNSKYTYMLQVEDYFNELDTDGFTTEYENMFAKLKSLQGNPSDLTYRTEFLNYAQSVADYFNEIQTKLVNLQKECNTEVSNLTERVNKLSSQIASVTKQINTVELSGAAANDLRDKRALLLDELSEIVPIDVNETTSSNGKTDFSVKVQGYPLVEGYSAHELVLVAREGQNSSMDAAGLYDVYYYYDSATGSGTKFDVQAMGLSGALRATLDVRDGNNDVADENIPDSKPIDYKGVPHYMNSLQSFKQTMADAFNDIHQNSTRIDENGNEVPANYNLYGESTKDIPIFIMSPNGVLTVNDALIKDPSLLGFSSYPIQDGKDDGGLVDKLLELKDKKIFGGANASEYLESIVSEISIDVKKSNTFLENYTNIKKSVDNQRMSVSGVDGDEEAMNLTKYQEAFELSSKMISVMADLYDVLIKQTGV